MLTSSSSATGPGRRRRRHGPGLLGLAAAWSFSLTVLHASSVLYNAPGTDHSDENGDVSPCGYHSGCVTLEDHWYGSAEVRFSTDEYWRSDDAPYCLYVEYTSDRDVDLYLESGFGGVRKTLPDTNGRWRGGVLEVRSGAGLAWGSRMTVRLRTFQDNTTVHLSRVVLFAGSGSGSDFGAPVPSYTVVQCPAEVRLGDSFEVQVSGRNEDGWAPQGTLAVSFPGLNTAADKTHVTVLASDFRTTTLFGQGETLTDVNDQAVTALYAVVEGVSGSAAPWKPGTTRSLRLSVTPKQAGDFRVQVRGAVADLGLGTRYQAPASGTTDQQGYPVEQRIVRVTETTRIIRLAGDLNFAGVQVGSTAQRTLTLHNDGNAPLAVHGISHPVGFSGNWTGIVPAGGLQNVPVTFAPAADFEYSGYVSVSSDATSGTATRWESGRGTPVPTRSIRLSGNLDFGNVQVGNTAQQVLTIWNDGNSTLSVTSLSFPAGFSGSWSGNVSPASSVNVNVVFAPSQATTYAGTAAVASNATAGSATLAVSGTGTAAPQAPAISFSPTSLAVSVVQGQDAAPRSLELWNSGGGTLSYAVTDDADWLSVTPGSGTSQGEHDLITLGFQSAGLGVGSRHATLTIRDANASNSPQTLPVALTVTPVVSAMHQLGAGGYVSPGRLAVHAQFGYPAGNSLLSLLWRPQLPPGWVLESVTGDGTPDIHQGEIVFTGGLAPNPVRFDFVLTVPAAQSGDKELRGIAEYTLAGMVNPFEAVVTPDPLMLAPVRCHVADYRSPFWVVDGTEANRVLAYWRSGAYHSDLQGYDGYAPGPGAQEGRRHNADFRATHWAIDGTEANRILAYWRADGYHVDPAGLDGYAPGAAAARGGPDLPATRTDPSASQQSGTSVYTPGGTVRVTGRFQYSGVLLSLLWRPLLPVGWTVGPGTLNGSGTIEMQAGEMLWVGALPPSPVELSYEVSVPASASGEVTLRAEVEYQVPGQANPVTLAAQPDLAAQPGGNGWRVTLALTSADKPSVQFGMDPAATDSCDELDLDWPQQPPPGSEIGGACFYDSQDFLYQRDLRAPAEAATWHLELVANQAPVTLFWASGQAPPDRFLRLQQVSADEGGVALPGRTHDLARSGTLTVPAGTTAWVVIDLLTAPFAETADLVLHRGWNLVSLPVEPLQPDAAAVLDEIAGRAAASAGAPGLMRDGRRGTVYAGHVWRWVAGVDSHYEAVTEMHALTGYWVCATEPVTIPVSGTAILNAVELAAGWNLFGPATACAVPVDSRLQGHCWTWDAVAGAYVRVEDPLLLTPGHAYWLFARQPFVPRLDR